MSMSVRGQEPVTVSMIELVANGEAFDGQRIRVVGVPSVGFEHSYMYYSEESYKKIRPRLFI